MDNPFTPPAGPRSFQAAGMDVERKQREISNMYRDEDWEAAMKASDSITPYERHARALLETKMGGAPGGMTFDKGDVFCQDADDE